MCTITPKYFRFWGKNRTLFVLPPLLTSSLEFSPPKMSKPTATVESTSLLWGQPAFHVCAVQHVCLGSGRVSTSAPHTMFVLICFQRDIWTHPPALALWRGGILKSPLPLYRPCFNLQRDIVFNFLISSLSLSHLPLFSQVVPKHFNYIFGILFDSTIFLRSSYWLNPMNWVLIGWLGTLHIMLNISACHSVGDTPKNSGCVIFSNPTNAT